MRRHAVFERVKQMAELGVDPFAAHAEDFKNPLLELAYVNADAAAGDLGAVEDTVVGPRANRIGLRVDEVHVLWPRGREWMVAVRQLALVVLLEQIHRINPGELPFAIGDEIAATSDLATQQAHHRLRLPAAVRDKKDEILLAGSGGGPNRCELTLGHVLLQWSGQPRKAFRTRTPRDQRELIQLAARHVASARHAKTAHDAAVHKRGAKNGGACLTQGIADVSDLEVVSKVGLDGAITEQRLLHVESRQRRGDVDAEDFLPDLDPQALDQIEDVLFRAERHLDVQLRDLHDPIGAQVFVAQAAGDLVVAARAGHHQQLLQLLGRLGQREEVAGMEARWNDEIARTLRSSFEEHRGFDLDELVRVHVAMHRVHDAVAHLQHPLHAWAP